MDKEYELKYHKLEENYWWFRARRKTVLSLVKQLNLSKDSKILEIGCSGGPLISILRDEGYINVFGIDLSENAIEVCKERGIENTFVMDAVQMGFLDNEFDLIIASDILEHIEDDSKALKEWNRVLKTNGRLIVFVPAFQLLWSSHDEINHHYRRYSKQLLLNRLKSTSFGVVRSSYWNFTLFFPSFFVRVVPNLFRKSTINSDQLYAINPFINRFLLSLLSMENKMYKLNFPIGVSVYSVCKKN